MPEVDIKLEAVIVTSGLLALTICRDGEGKFFAPISSAFVSKRSSQCNKALRELPFVALWLQFETL